MPRLIFNRLAALLLTTFMVMVLPMCWYGALAHAAVLGIEGPPTSNNNEEREEHDERDDGEKEGFGTRPPDPPAPIARSHHGTSIVQPAATAPPAITASVAPAVHPSQFSVRRLR